MPRDFHSREGIDEWLQSLDDRWPARAAVSKHIVAQTEALPAFDPHVVELAPDGLFLNADLLHNPEDPRPGRLPIERHLSLLSAHGFQRPSCTLETGGFGCIVGFA